MDRPHADAEGRGVSLPTRPSLPKQGASCTLTLSFACITHPEQLNHGVSEGKTAAGRTLTEMLIWRSLMQTELNKCFGLGSAWSVQTNRWSNSICMRGSVIQSDRRLVRAKSVTQDDSERVVGKTSTNSALSWLPVTRGQLQEALRDKGRIRLCAHPVSPAATTSNRKVACSISRC